MKRYQIVYSKSDNALVAWAKDKQRAVEMAQRFRNAGYSVDVWEHTKDGVRRVDL